MYMPAGINLSFFGKSIRQRQFCNKDLKRLSDRSLSNLTSQCSSQYRSLKHSAQPLPFCRATHNGRQGGWKGKAPEGTQERPQGVRRGGPCSPGKEESGGEGPQGTERKSKGWLYWRSRPQEVWKEIKRTSPAGFALFSRAQQRQQAQQGTLGSPWHQQLTSSSSRWPQEQQLCQCSWQMGSRAC